jgi:hypothetical protein
VPVLGMALFLTQTLAASRFAALLASKSQKQKSKIAKLTKNTQKSKTNTAKQYI